MKKAFVFGINGKMGGALRELAPDFGYEVVGGFDTAADKQRGVVTDVNDAALDYDVIIDFSRPITLSCIVALVERKPSPVVIATTGYNDSELFTIKLMAQNTPVLRSANLSLGIAAAKAAAKTAKAVLGDGFDIEIVEKHHNKKADAPSGTAIMLADALAPRDKQVFGRDDKRKPGELGITSVRGGGTVGIHEIGFYGEDEYVTITHTANSRRLFAAGAFKAADFLIGKPAGLYDMDDVVAELIK